MGRGVAVNYRWLPARVRATGKCKPVQVTVGDNVLTTLNDRRYDFFPIFAHPDLYPYKTVIVAAGAPSQIITVTSPSDDPTVNFSIMSVADAHTLKYWLLAPLDNFLNVVNADPNSHGAGYVYFYTDRRMTTPGFDTKQDCKNWLRGQACNPVRRFLIRRPMGGCGCVGQVRGQNELVHEYSTEADCKAAKPNCGQS